MAPLIFVVALLLFASCQNRVTYTASGNVFQLVLNGRAIRVWKIEFG
jgi:hypothetical protein